jgi:hypothetical protein
MSRHLRPLLLAALLLAGAGRAEAAFLTGDRLLELCASSDAQDHAICSAYIVGTADAMVGMQGFTTLKSRVCFAPQVTSNALINAVIAHARQRPEDAHGSGADLVYTALATFYPC